MTDSKFVYVTYISSTPEKIWDALTKPELTRNYWGYDNVSDWKRGSKWKSAPSRDPTAVGIVGEVIESERPRRLVFTWADAAEASDLRKHSRVCYDLEPMRDMVKLTVTHDELPLGSVMAGKISEGWPRVLSSLKSYLETGRSLDTWAGRKAEEMCHPQSDAAEMSLIVQQQALDQNVRGATA